MPLLLLLLLLWLSWPVRQAGVPTNHAPATHSLSSSPGMGQAGGSGHALAP